MGPIIRREVALGEYHGRVDAEPRFLGSAIGNVRTTMIYTHVMRRGGFSVRSPADSL